MSIALVVAKPLVIRDHIRETASVVLGDASKQHYVQVTKTSQGHSNYNSCPLGAKGEIGH